MLLGDSGTGKSHLLIGLGLATCQRGLRVRYTTAAQLVTELAEDCNVGGWPSLLGFRVDGLRSTRLTMLISFTMENRRDPYDAAYDYALESAELSEAKCLIGPAHECSRLIVRAHSIQRAKLDLISDEHKKVVIMTPDVRKLNQKGITAGDLASGAESGFEYRSTSNRLLTTRMACSYHDKETFALIEDHSLDVADHHHCDLLSLRAALFQMHKKMIFYRVFSTMALADIELIDARDALALQMHEAKRATELIVAGLSGEPGTTMEHRAIAVDCPPRVAATGVIMRGGPVYPWSDRELAAMSERGVPIPANAIPIVVTVYPDIDRHVAIVSFPNGWASLAEIIVPAIAEKDGFRAAASLSKTLIEHTENIALSPQAWNGYGRKKREAITRYFMESIGLPIVIEFPLGESISPEMVSQIVSAREPASRYELDAREIDLFN